jgi:hypothetical protein
LFGWSGMVLGCKKVLKMALNDNIMTSEIQLVRWKMMSKSAFWAGVKMTTACHSVKEVKFLSDFIEHRWSEWDW